MNVPVKLVLLGLALGPLAAQAQDAPKLNCLTDFVFSQEFLQKYPNAGAACREIVEKNGQKWARFDANVDEVRGEKVTATFTSTHDRPLTKITFEASPDARVEMNGKDIKFTELKKGEKISFWVSEDRLTAAEQPGDTAESWSVLPPQP